MYETSPEHVPYHPSAYAMVAQPIPIWFVCGFFLTRRECSGFTTTTTTVIPGVSTSTATAYSYTSSPPRYSRHHDDPCSPLLCASSLLPSGKPARAAALAATVAAATGGGGRGAARATALYAKGFGSPPAGPNPRAYYPAGDDDDDDDDGNDDRDNGHTAGTTTTTTTGGGGDGQPPPPSFPDFAEARKVEEPKGIGTLFERGDEVIRELSSEEYLDVLRDWAPLASFASKEALDPAIRKEAVSIRTVLRGMAVSTYLLALGKSHVYTLEHDTKCASTRPREHRTQQHRLPEARSHILAHVPPTAMAAYTTAVVRV